MSRWLMRRSKKVKATIAVLAIFMVFAGIGAVTSGNAQQASVQADRSVNQADYKTTEVIPRERIDANRTEVETVTETVPFTTTTTYDGSLAKDTTVVRVDGQDGKKVVRTEVRYKGGTEISRSLISESITVPAVTKVVAIGTKMVAKAKPKVEVMPPTCPELPDQAAIASEQTCDAEPATGDSESSDNQ